MAEYILPTDLNLQWASSGDVLKPTDTKIQQGWQPEIPPRQWFNWLDNRQDQAIAHIAQHGISVWSSTLEYQAGKSYVQGSDGLIYKALTTNTNINPVGGAPGNWETAFVTSATATQVASTAQAQAQTANNVYISPLALANALKGTNQSLVTNGFQKLPGGLIIQWGASAQTTTDVAVVFPVAFPNQVFRILTHDSNTIVAAEMSIFQVASPSLSGFTARNICKFTRGSSSVGATTSAACQWFAIGY